MPTFTYSSSGFPFTPFTKILSADVNTCFTDLKTFLNVTKLDDSNLQNAGITPTTKLNQSGSTAGQFLASNGSAVVWSNNPLLAQFNVIFGSAANVMAGTATHSAVASWTQADNDRVLILPSYTETANWTITKKVYITGLGNFCQITGSVTFATGSSKSKLINCRVTTGVTTNSGIESVRVSAVWFPTGITFTDNATALANTLDADQET